MCKRGEIYWINFDKYTSTNKNSMQHGVRPAIIIQNDIGNRYSPTVLVSPITTQLKKLNMPTHILLDKKCGLRIESMVLLEQIYTIPKIELNDYIGKASYKEIKEINKALNISLATEEKNKVVDLDYIEETKYLISIRIKNYEKEHKKDDLIIIKSLEYSLHAYCEDRHLNYESLFKTKKAIAI